MSLKGDFGVYLVAYELMRRKRRVLINQGRLVKTTEGYREIQGYDLLSINRDKKSRIEVKLMDADLRTQANKKNLRQRATAAEAQNSDFVIIVVWSNREHHFYIIPRRAFTRAFGKKTKAGEYNISVYNSGKSKAKIESYRVNNEKDWGQI